MRPPLDPLLQPDELRERVPAEIICEWFGISRTNAPSSTPTPATTPETKDSPKLAKLQKKEAALDAQIKSGSPTGDALATAQKQDAKLKKQIAKLQGQS